MTAPTLDDTLRGEAPGRNGQTTRRGRPRARCARDPSRHGESGVRTSTPAPPVVKAEEVPGAIGRMPVSELTLHLAGPRVRSTRIRELGGRLLRTLGVARDPPSSDTARTSRPTASRPTTSSTRTATSAQAIEALPEAERADYRAKLLLAALDDPRGLGRLERPRLPAQRELRHRDDAASPCWRRTCRARAAWLGTDPGRAAGQVSAD